MKPLLDSVCAAYATVHGQNAVYLMKLSRGWGKDLFGWEANKLRVEATHSARLAARYALMNPQKPRHVAPESPISPEAGG